MFRVILTAATVLVGACAHETRPTYARGEPVGVNSVDAKSAPVTGSVTGSIQPSPTAMATTTSPEPPIRPK